jgi:sialate O-acetylesterase
MMKVALVFFITFQVILANLSKKASIELTSIFSDHIVLQQKTENLIWGKAEPNTNLKIKPSWGNIVNTRSNDKGNWKAKISTPEAGGPYTIEISSKWDRKIINDVMIGEVWLCSGQSNMRMPLNGSHPIENGIETIESADYPKIRMFNVEKTVATTPQTDINGDWIVCSPKTAGGLSAVAFFFGKKLFDELNVPIGLIHSSWGGSPAESWASLNALKTINPFEDFEQKITELNNQKSEYNMWMKNLNKIDLKTFNENDDNLVNKDYISINYDDVHWKSMKIPNWFSGPLQNFDGIIWFRKSFELTKVEENITYTLSLGGIDDNDETYLNGVKIGRTQDWTKKRNYVIPVDLLKQGKNTISVEVFDGAGNGGIYGGDDFGIKKEGEFVLDLSGDWKYLPSAILIGNDIKFFTTDFSYDKMPAHENQINNKLPTGLFNSMIHPLKLFSIKGVIWYQGESNVSRSEQYKLLFPAMIKSWRKNWNSEFSFYFTQIAPYVYSGINNSESAELRNAQNYALSLPKTGQAVTLDIGSMETIHPPKKKEVGERLAYWALAKDYEQKSVAFSGPICRVAKQNEGHVVLEFDIGAEYLVEGKDGLKEFELIYSSLDIEQVNAEIQGNTIVLENKSEIKPIAVRYAWKNGSQASLFNTENLPAPTFYLNIIN